MFGRNKPNTAEQPAKGQMPKDPNFLHDPTVQGQTPGKTLAQVLLTMSAATEAQILSAIADTLGLPYETPEKQHVDPDAFGGRRVRGKRCRGAHGPREGPYPQEFRDRVIRLVRCATCVEPR